MYAYRKNVQIRLAGTDTLVQEPLCPLKNFFCKEEQYIGEKNCAFLRKTFAFWPLEDQCSSVFSP